MKTHQNTGRLVAELRKIIGKSQTRFATMIGASKHTIISVENGRNQLSRKLAEKIQIATGADLSGGTLENYTVNFFNDWRTKYYPSNEASARKRFEEIQTWVKIIFLAAAKPGLAGNRDRLPAVFISLAQWLDETRQKFKLHKEIDDLLEDETRTIGRTAFSLSYLLEKPKKAKAVLAEHGLDYSKIKSLLKRHPPHHLLIIKDEFWRDWDPSGSCISFVCKTRKLIPKAKYRVKPVPSDTFTAHQLERILWEPEPQDS